MEFEISDFKFSIPVWGCSSVGRAVALQAIGQEFESPQLHQPSLAAKRERGCRAGAKRRRAVERTQLDCCGLRLGKPVLMGV